MTELEQVQKELTRLEAEQSAIVAELGPLQARLADVYEMLAPLREKRGELRLAAGDFDWGTALRDLASEERSSKALRRHVQAELGERFDMWLSGYWSDTQEAVIDLKVGRTDESEGKNLAGLRFFTPLLTPHANGRVWFGVFEHSLSVNGSYRLEATRDFPRELVLLRRDRELQRFTSAEEAVRYVRTHHWYGEETR